MEELSQVQRWTAEVAVNWPNKFKSSQVSLRNTCYHCSRRCSEETPQKSSLYEHNVVCKVCSKVLSLLERKYRFFILCSVTFFFPENRAVYEIMSKNVVEPERSQMIIWRMYVACWIIKVTRAKAHARAGAPTHARTRIHTQNM